MEMNPADDEARLQRLLNSTLDDKGVFRVKDWWRSKAALLMGMVYLFALWFDIPFEKFLSLALLSMITISGFASFGYLLNDYFDIGKDAKAGKKNFLANKPPALITLFFALSLTLLLLPWRWLPFDGFSLTLIAGEAALFLIYSLPPLRLKERGLAGIAVDALYAHALPVVLAAYTFAAAAEKPFVAIPVLLLFTWQAFSGIRNILMHQSDDIASDRKAGVRNYVAALSVSFFRKALVALITAEILTAIVFFATVARQENLLYAGAGIIALSGLLVLFLFGKKGVAAMLQTDWKYFPNNIYEKWLPAGMLLSLAYFDIRFALLLVAHVALFNFEFYRETCKRVLLPCFIRLQIISFHARVNARMAAAFLVNHAIYYAFLIFGIDLKKENASALDYLRKLRKSKQR